MRLCVTCDEMILFEGEEVFELEKVEEGMIHMMRDQPCEGGILPSPTLCPG